MDSRSLEAIAREIVCSATGAMPRSAREEPRGVMTFKFIVEMQDDEQFIVRFYPADRSHVVEFEPDLMRIAVKSGVLAPQVITDSRSGPEAPMAYCMYRMIGGNTLTDVWAALSDAQIGRLVSEISENLELLTSIRVTGFGGLRTANRSRYSTWEEFLHRSIDAGVGAARRLASIDDSLFDKIDAVAKNYSEFARCENATITWSDISPDNIIVSEDGRLEGFIDFEGVLSGDHMMTLGYLFARYHETDFAEQILQSFHSNAGDPSFRKVSFFAVLRGLRLLPHLRQPLPTGVKRQALLQTLPGFEPALDELLGDGD